MIGIWSGSAQAVALWFGIATLVIFAIPLFFTPLLWARMLLWRRPEDTDLAVYFGRCLGAFALAMDFMLIRAGLSGVALQPVFEIMIGFSALMVAVHVYGAIAKIQPLTETLEIVFWAAALALFIACFPPG
ncbi:MAG: hypothetical protein JWQ90_4387 [Hydrocarboniphaga sp.]|uniref:hypothetical protein n=1 Tax=Hydrocarboniphaga sp. TaxID=2033016 RepID=UPI002625E68B|nr:hypothetical protein [Hydrocarboniphaga sp.]MDB5971937.1 hypothetical protein [Hydrocarboniphaga sp.]